MSMVGFILGYVVCMLTRSFVEYLSNPGSVIAIAKISYLTVIQVMLFTSISIACLRRLVLSTLIFIPSLTLNRAKGWKLRNEFRSGSRRI